MRRAVPITLLLLVGGCLIGDSTAMPQVTDAVDTVDAVKTADTVKPARAAAIEALKVDVRAFQSTIRDQPAEAAVQQWLTLWDRQATLARPSDPTPDQRFFDKELSLLEQVMLAMPPPEHWSALDRAITARPRPAAATAARRDLALRMFGKLLINDSEAQRQLFNDMLKAADIDPADRSLMLRTSQWSTLHEAVHGPIRRVLDFELLLDTQVPLGTALHVPDLVSLEGEVRANELLRRALTETNYQLSTVVGRDTCRLVRELSLANIRKLKCAPWCLVETPADAGLYEALAKRFPPPRPTDDGVLAWLIGNRTADMETDQADAMRIYQIGLVQQAKFAEAHRVQLILEKDLAFQLFKEAPQAWHHDVVPAMHAFAERQVAKHPLLYCEMLVKYAIQTNQAPNAVALLQTASQLTSLQDHEREEINSALIDAMLAAGQVDDAVPLLKQSVRPENLLLSEHRHAGARNESVVVAGIEFDIAQRIFNIGRALKRPDVAEQGLALFTDIHAQVDEQLNPAARAERFLQLASMHHYLGRTPQAVQHVLSACAKPGRPARQKVANGDQTSPVSLPSILNQLLHLYEQDNDETIMVWLLEHSDVDECLSWSAGWEQPGSSELRLSAVHAAILDQQGHRDQARAVVGRSLDRRGNFDPTYEMLLRLYPDPAEAIAKLDEQIARFPIEERPLIWKAELLRRHGRLQEAEAAIRRAVYLDSTDLDQENGNRLRAFQVLAEIQFAMGKPAVAMQSRQLAEAARLLDEVQWLKGLGLHQQALARAQEGLKLYPDSFLVQHHFAEWHHLRGEKEKSELHFRRALDLLTIEPQLTAAWANLTKMPIAFPATVEPLLMELATQQPDRPQVHYYLACLRCGQDRHAEALQSLEAAVRLDPDYWDAWLLIDSMYREAVQTVWESSDEESVTGSWQQCLFSDTVPAELRAATELQMFRLNPYRRSYSFFVAISNPDRMDSVRDLRLLWTTVAAVPIRQIQQDGVEATKRRDGGSEGRVDRISEIRSYPARLVLKLYRVSAVIDMMHDGPDK